MDDHSDLQRAALLLSGSIHSPRQERHVPTPLSDTTNTHESPQEQDPYDFPLDETDPNQKRKKKVLDMRKRIAAGTYKVSNNIMDS